MSPNEITSSEKQKVTAKQLSEIAGKLGQIATNHGRSELHKKFRVIPVTLMNTEVEIVVVGQFKQGKSALVNALIDAPVCPVDDVLATSVPTVVKWGEETSASLITDLGKEKGHIKAEVELGKLRQHVTELAGETGLLGRLHAEVKLPRPILSRGFTFIDTPGVGRAQTRAATNLTLLPQADAAIMVTDATQEFTEPEISFLKQATALCKRTICVVSKTDLQHEWRKIVETNAEHLRNANINIPMLANSSLLYNLASEENDTSLREESKIDVLTSFLENNLKSNVIAMRQRSVAEEIDSTAKHLVLAFESELQMIKKPENGKAIIKTLKGAEANAGKLAKRSARWQQTLTDGAGDLLADIEFDLRDRLRNVGKEAEDLIDASDPGKVWDSIGEWLAESITQAVSDNFVWAHKRSIHLAEVVAEHFAVDGQKVIPELELDGVDDALGAIGGLDLVKSGKLMIGQKIMIGLKGSYGGVLMFGLMTTLAGMALVNPLSIAAGLIMGGFAYRQDASQRLEQRRQEAKNAVRKLIDEAIFQVGKESRDRMGRIRRTLRDHFVQVAEDLKDSLQASISSAKEVSGLPKSAQSLREEHLIRELAQTRALAEMALKLTNIAPVNKGLQLKERISQ
ncbi:MAG TPA: dynamin family protein [Microbacteriaceae bacterium]|nr:dynamin family protein [Microbacteriaceae bacterium]